MFKKKTRCSLLTVTCSLFFVSLLSCRTTPPIPKAMLPENGFLPLDPGASAYIIADTEKSRPILEHLRLPSINNKQFAQMLDRTCCAAAALYLPGSERLYQLCAWGSYPAARANMAFGTNKGWKKQRSAQTGTAFWYSAKDGLSAAIEPGQAFAAAAWSDLPADPFSAPPGTVIPEGFGEFITGAALAFWIENPAAVLNKKISEMGIPIELPVEQFFVGLHSEPESPQTGGEQEFTASIRLQFPGESQAKGLLSILGFARGFFSDDAASGGDMLTALLFSNPPLQDGRNLDFKTHTLSAREISLLFRLFLL